MPRAQAALIPPKDLAEDARARWTAVVRDVAKRGRVDRELLATYCRVWVRWQKAEVGLSASGQLVKNHQGSAIANPLIAVSNQAAAQVRALEKQLGLGDQAEHDEGQRSRVTGPTLTRRELAAVLNVHMQTVTKWEHDGLPIARRGRKGKPSRYREADARAWLAAREDQAQRAGLVDVAQERARKERAQAELAEQTFQQRAHRLLPADEVARIWTAEITAVRSIILSSYTTHADRLYRAATLQGLPGVEAALKDLAYEVLRELANTDRAMDQAS